LEVVAVSLEARNVSGVLTYFKDGVQVTAAQARTEYAATADGTAAVNEKALLDKAKAALTANATFLAIATPSNAQVSAQVKALTRQVNALIKLAARDLADTSGT
jgi:hypothetical protein